MYHVSSSLNAAHTDCLCNRTLPGVKKNDGVKSGMLNLNKQEKYIRESHKDCEREQLR